MRILITGAAGFLGQWLAEELLNETEHQLVLTDVNEPPIPKSAKIAQNAVAVKADLTHDAARVVPQDLDAAYLFHGIMSQGSEENHALGMRVNLDATRALLDALRLKRPGIRVIYASSQAVYGQPLPDMVTEDVAPTPESSYGSEKLICEALVNDYTRRNFVDGFSLRFPTITVRPGLPSNAVPSFISGVIREPLNGKTCIIPIRDRTYRCAAGSPRILVKNLIHALTLPSDALPPHRRFINPPGFSATVQEMLDALQELGGKHAVQLVREVDNPEAERILRSWPKAFDNSLALKLGFHKDVSFLQAAADYKSNLKT